MTKLMVFKLEEEGYTPAVLGFSLSYRSTIKRTELILPKYAFGRSGERKFLESIYTWWDVLVPRGIWQEMDTYRISTKQSESTMHTLCKKPVTQEDYEYPIDPDYLEKLNALISEYKESKDSKHRRHLKVLIKNGNPEGYLQRRVWCFNYAVIQNIYNQRHDHELPQWHFFLYHIINQIQHPEFIIEGFTLEKFNNEMTENDQEYGTILKF